MKRRRSLIVDDERLARRDLLVTLRAFPQVEVVGEAESVAQAISSVEALAPELVFLDVQLSKGSGFDVLPAIKPGTRVIFVTAHDRFAVRAFEVNALDYLLKPVEPGRLGRALARLDEPEAAEQDLPPFDAEAQFCATGVGFVAVRAIRRISADGNYTVVFTTDGRQHYVKQSLTSWERRLPEALFHRISRTDLVQLALVTQLDRLNDGTCRVFLVNETEPLVVSRRAASALRERLREKSVM